MNSLRSQEGCLNNDRKLYFGYFLLSFPMASGDYVIFPLCCVGTTEKWSKVWPELCVCVWSWGGGSGGAL